MHSHFIKEKERSRDILESPTIEVVPVPLISKVKAGLVDRYRTHLFKGMALKSNSFDESPVTSHRRLIKFQGGVTDAQIDQLRTLKLE